MALLNTGRVWNSAALLDNVDAVAFGQICFFGEYGAAGSKPERWPDGKSETVHDAAAQRNDATPSADHSLEIDVHNYGQVLDLEYESPAGLWIHLESRSDTEYEPRRACLGSRHKCGTKTYREERSDLLSAF